jgi:ribosomal protein S18 acetylase RimI-like enzyme
MDSSQSVRDVSVRRLTEEDWVAFRAARLAALADAPAAFSSTLAGEQQFGEEVWRARTRSAAFAAWAGAEIAGMATVLRPGQADNPGWELVGMWVSPRWRGTGVADKLVAAVCEQARTCGAEQISLWVVEDNGRAIGLYHRLGFRSTGGRQLVRPDEPGRWEIQLTLGLR